MKKKRFIKGRIYRCRHNNICGTTKRYKYLMPVDSDNGQYSIMDCWIVDKDGNVHPGYNCAAVPVSVDNILGELDYVL